MRDRYPERDGGAFRRAGAKPANPVSDGTNIGDVVSDDEAIYGDGITVASRLKSLAEPGGINISRAVPLREHAGRQLEPRVVRYPKTPLLFGIDWCGGPVQFASMSRPQIGSGSKQDRSPGNTSA